MELFKWDRLNDEQKFNLALWVTVDFMSRSMKSANPTNRQEFIKSVEEIDFCSFWVNIYFEYSFWLVIEYLSETKHKWFVESLLTAFKELGLQFIQYQNAIDIDYCRDNEREYKQCQILFRNKGM